MERNIVSGHSARRERRKGFVPGILYGKRVENFLFEVGELELRRELSLSGEHGIINFNLNGRSEKALLKEVQRDPVSHKVIHIDLEEITTNKEIQSEVPIQFVGEEWLNNKGAVLQKEKAVVKVTCKPDDLPRSFKVDVSKGKLGDVYRFEDLEFGEEISIIDDIHTVVASISNENRLTSQLGEQEMENRDTDKEEKKSED
ncbi:50S ribosomal protein L25 [Clostridium sp. Sa3CVN1]|uniref:Large ribosomal subunit protein bL25 n=2 Tax=Clostridiaceae TaxID=31979 RepID=A0ABR8PPJ9_9CLOT|nr:50S ribosomal protein L25 [Clostridium cibarium]